MLSIAAPALAMIAPSPATALLNVAAQGIGKYAELKEQVVNANDVASNVVSQMPGLGF